MSTPRVREDILAASTHPINLHPVYYSRVARDMTASLLMPPPPPPPSEILMASRLRDDPTESSMKRQRPCSPQDERKLSRRHGLDLEDVGDRESGRLMRPKGYDASGPEGGSHYSGNYRSGPGGYSDGGRPGGYSDGGRPGGFPSGPGSFMDHGGPWGWRPGPGPYSDLPLRPGPFSRPPGGGLGSSQSPYSRNLRDRMDLEEGMGGNRRLGRGGGGRGGFSFGSRGGRDRRW